MRDFRRCVCLVDLAQRRGRVWTPWVPCCLWLRPQAGSVVEPTSGRAKNGGKGKKIAIKKGPLWSTKSGTKNKTRPLPLVSRRSAGRTKAAAACCWSAAAPRRAGPGVHPSHESNSQSYLIQPTVWQHSLVLISPAWRTLLQCVAPCRFADARVSFEKSASGFR